MTIRIVTAIGAPRWEAELTAGLAGTDVGLQVVRRCVDVADLQATAAAGLVQAAVVSADLRRLDREVVARLGAAGVAVVGLAGANEEVAERQLRQLGIEHVVPHDASPEQLARAVMAAIDAVAHEVARESSSSWGDPAAALAGPDEAARDEAARDETVQDQTVQGGGQVGEGGATGRIIAVWGPVGAPGRSTVSTNLAAELCALGHAVVLIDADTYGGVIAQLLGVLDEAPGLAAACRLANQGALDVLRFAKVALELRPGLRLLTGITRPDRWLEVRPAALEVVLEISRSVAAFTVIDCGFCLEQDEELAYDTAAPRRNGATLAALIAADVVVGVAAADPVGLARYVRAWPDFLAVVEPVRPVTVANRLRKGVTGPGEPRRAVRSALERYAGLADVVMVPDDPEALDAAVAAGRTLSESAPRSAARKAIRDLAVRLGAP